MKMDDEIALKYMGNEIKSITILSLMLSDFGKNAFFSQKAESSDEGES